MDEVAKFRVRDWACEYTMFSLQELSRISGISPNHLRVWRSRGHLAETLGAPDQFTSMQVAELLVRHRLTHGSMPPGESGEIGNQGAKALLWHAVVNHEVCEIWGTREDVDRCKEDFRHSGTVANALLGVTNPGAFILRSDRGEVSLQRDVSAFFDYSKRQTQFVVFLENIADAFVEQAQRPLFKLEVSQPEHGKRVKGFA